MNDGEPLKPGGSLVTLPLCVRDFQSYVMPEAYMRGKMFQVAILYNLEDDVPRGDAHDLLAIQYTANTTQYIHDALSSLGYNTHRIAVRDSLTELEHALASYSPEDTFIFDNCDGFNGNNLAAVRVLKLVEELGFPHTGTTAEGIELCTDKPRAKERLMEFGIPTPAYQVFERPEGEIHLNFPVIVKPATEDASMGIDLHSVATHPAALFESVQLVIEHYEQPAMVEQFIPGREVAVAMWGNALVETLPISEEDYSSISDPLQRLLTFEAKWEPDSYYYKNIMARCPADISPEDEIRIQQVAVATFHAMGLRDFGRVDIRYHEGIPYVIDINELPDLSPESGFWNSARAAGWLYPVMIEHILQHALKREGWQ
jgi:D-alanine-D-alanine ligase